MNGVSSVFTMVTNEKYSGNALLQKSFVNNHLEKKQVKNRGELSAVLRRGNLTTRSADPETFAKAQERIEASRLAAEERPKPTRSAFTGKIRCVKCGKNYKRAGTASEPFELFDLPFQGSKGLPVLQIPEPLLYSITAKALGLEEFDQDALRAK